MKIDPLHIEEAAKLLIGSYKFDDERIEFITNLDTCDLLAVPGSGKTTALIAKLYCLSQKLPFTDGSGILVLAHTNHAVEEIEKKLKKHSPHLFEYPNFVGTIQSFINRFLTIPLYNQKNNNKFKIIEYEDYIKEFDYHLAHTKEAIAYFKNNNPSIYYSANLNINLDGTIYVCTENKDEEINLKCPQKWIKENTSETKIEEVKKFIIETKIKIFQKGYLNYSDCYFYAKKNVFENPILKEILQKRFKYVFIDEMQDLEKFQINIIDDIFFSESSKTVIQRIGDINQSIYSSGKKIKVECDWKPRKIEYLKSSYRLTEEIANLVNGFTLDPQKDENQNPRFVVIGLNKLDKIIKPHLIVFNESTTGEQLEQKFEDLIIESNLHYCDENIKNGFKIIGWSTVWDKDEQKQGKDGIVKIRIKDLFDNYSKESKAKKEDFDCLKKYLHLFDLEKQTLEAVRKSILNSFIRILRFEDIYFDLETKKHFRKSTLIIFIKNQGEEVYENFKVNLFEWCFCLVTKNDFENVFQKIKEYVSNTFIKWNWYNQENYIQKIINKSNDFINSANYQFTEIIKNETANIGKSKNGINIEISSVHSVKGQTHCATMYIESAYNTPVYETNKLTRQTKNNPLFFLNHDCEKLRGKEAIKMMYVGFSRPTHLLCFAVLEENIKNDKEKFEKAGWELIDLVKK